MKIILLAVILAICATLIAGQPDRKVILTPHENAFIGNEFQAGTHVAGATGTFGGSGLAGSGTRNVIGMGGVTGLKDFFTRCLGIGFDEMEVSATASNTESSPVSDFLPILVISTETAASTRACPEQGSALCSDHIVMSPALPTDISSLT